MVSHWEIYQIPPAVLDRSKTVTSIPSFLRCAAVTIPEIPAPITATLLLLRDMINCAWVTAEEQIRTN
jgi:hypothetical protein